MTKDYSIRALSKDGYLNIICATCRDMVEDARLIHKTAPTATAALGRCLIATSMMGSELKVPEGSITLKIDGGGEAGSILCVSDYLGKVRGYMDNPFVDPPRKRRGKLDVGTAVGKNGYIQVIRDIGMREPYIGRVPLVSGEIAEDVTSYYFTSEQSPSVCGLGVLIGTDGKVSEAGGYLIRLLPDAPEDVISSLEACAPLFTPVTDMLSSGASPDEIIKLLLPGFDMLIMEESRLDVCYECKCSRERVSRALISMGREELLSFANDTKETPAEIKCQFCDRVYNYTSDEIIKLYEEATRP